LISKKFEKEIVFESSVLGWIRIRNRIRIEQKCWIRIRNKSIRIHNPAINKIRKILFPTENPINTGTTCKYNDSLGK
jgi:hypothetical protein